MAMQDWMQNLDPTVTLDQITMPGSHDAGVWEEGTETVGLAPKKLSVCQSLSLGGQCQAGSRFFDVRVEQFGPPWQRELRALHLTAKMGGKGQFLDSMLDEVSRFVQSNNGSEFVIMRFTKCTNHADIINAVQYHCSNQLYKIGGYLSQATIQNLRGKVVAVFDKGFAEEMRARNQMGPAQGFHRFGKYGGGLTDGLITCGKYSNSQNLTEVSFGQYDHRIDHDLHTDTKHIFVLYWTQTGGNIRENTEGAHGTHQGLQNRVLDVYAPKPGQAQPLVKLPTVVLYDFVNVLTSTQIVTLNDPPYRLFLGRPRVAS